MNQINQVQREIVELHFSAQHKYSMAYFTDTVTMERAPHVLRLPYGRTIFLRLLNRYGLTTQRNMPSAEMLQLGFMKFRSNVKSMGPAVTYTPLLTATGLEYIKAKIPAEILFNKHRAIHG